MKKCIVLLCCACLLLGGCQNGAEEAAAPTSIEGTAAPQPTPSQTEPLKESTIRFLDLLEA